MSNEASPQSEIVLYQTEDGGTRLQVRLEGETVWLSLNQLADLFQRDKSVISRHIKNVFDEGELSRTATVAKSATVQTEGEKQVTRDIELYNLDVIISVGHRVKSLRGTQFRICATQRLRETIVKGFTMDDERLKQSGGGAYLDELLEKVFWRCLWSAGFSRRVMFQSHGTKNSKTCRLKPNAFMDWKTGSPTPRVFRPSAQGCR